MFALYFRIAGNVQSVSQVHDLVIEYAVKSANDPFLALPELMESVQIAVNPRAWPNRVTP